MLLFIFFTVSAVPVCAAGSGNVDGGGGSLNHGKDGYYWPEVGYDGVRVTVVDAQSGRRVSVPIDYTNLNVHAMSAAICHFGKVSKVDYKGGAGSVTAGWRICVPEACSFPASDYFRQQQKSQYSGYPALFLFRSGRSYGGE